MSDRASLAIGWLIYQAILLPTWALYLIAALCAAYVTWGLYTVGRAVVDGVLDRRADRADAAWHRSSNQQQAVAEQGAIDLHTCRGIAAAGTAWRRNTTRGTR